MAVPPLPHPLGTGKTLAKARARVKAGAKSKTHDDMCAQAVSDWKTSGMTPAVAAVLGKCRKMAAGKGAVPAAKGETPAVRPGSTAERAKYVGKKVTGKDKAFADAQEQRVARAVGGKWMPDDEPSDVEMPGARGKGDHLVEVKSILKGQKHAISMHDDALLRKVRYAGARPGSTYHTVVLDHRQHYEEGKHSADFSGHHLYYRRGAGAYSLGSMHRVKDEAELKRLIETPDHKLPEKARGTIPGKGEIPRLERNAKVARAGRLRRQRAWRASLKAEKGSQAQSP